MNENPKAVKKAAKGDKADHLAMLVEYFEESEEATRDGRSEAEVDRDYYDGKQWTSSEKAKLEKRGQPALVFNKIKRKVNFLTGHQEQTKADPKAFPRNYPADEEGAHAATDAMRYVQQEQMLEDKFSIAYEHMCIEGFGAIEVLFDVAKNKMDIKSWSWDRLFYDPYSAKADFSDAKYVGGVVWMDEDEAKEKYPENAAAIDATMEQHSQTQTETHDDKPRTTWVGAGKRKRVRVVQIYYRSKGDWWWAHYTKGGILAGCMPVIFKDEDGATECPLIMQSAYVDRDNNRYGEVRELRDIQDEVNKRRSKLLYHLSVRTVVADKGAVDNKEAARKEVARADGWIEKNPNRSLELLPNSDQSSGQAQLLQEAKQEMEFAGPNASLMGDTRAGASGRAIIASQQGGLTELGRFQARFRHLKLRVYRQIWNRVRQFWTAEKWIRVTDNENNIKFVGLNIPETIEDVLMAEAMQEADSPEEQQQAEQQIKQLTPDMVSQMFGVPLPEGIKTKTGNIKNNTAEMDMDIIIDEAPDTVTIQQEQFEQVVNLAQSGVPFDPEDIILLSNLRNKDKVLERIRKRTSPAEVPPEVEEMQRRDAEAEVAKKEASAVKDATSAQKNMADAQKTTAEAEKMAFDMGMSVAGV
jgi:hypothetical protein